MKCRVLKDGVTHRGQPVKVGEIIDVSEAAAAHLIPEGVLELAKVETKETSRKTAKVRS